MSQRFYAVARGRSVGIFENWAECAAATHGYAKAMHRSFKDYNEAVTYLRSNNVHQATDLIVRQMEEVQRLPVLAAKRPLADLEEKGAEAEALLPPAKRPALNGGVTEIRVYTDGSCLGNGQKHDQVIAGAGAWFGRQDPRNVSCLVPGKQTNNRAEVFAVYKALEQCPPRSWVVILTDSALTINGATRQSKRKANQDLFDMVDQITATMANVRYVKVLAHSGIEGNEMADALAKQACYRALRMAEKLVKSD